jgi:hypothetical protein
MQAIMVCAGLFLVVAFVLWVMLSFVGSRTSRALEETSRTLGLKQTTPEPDRREASSDVVYAGMVEGVEIRVGAGQRVTTTVQPTIVGSVSVSAMLPRPLGFDLEIRVAALGMPLSRTLRLGDKLFDKNCIVFTRDVEAAKAALASAEARDAVREFVKLGGTSAVITGNELYAGIFNVHWRGSRVILETVQRAVRAARALSKSVTP